jgi:hypothetical protein
MTEWVAIHFGVDGQPNDWMSRTAATLPFASFQIGMSIFLVGVNALAHRLPDSMLNILNREYWLGLPKSDAGAPEGNDVVDRRTNFDLSFCCGPLDLPGQPQRHRAELPAIIATLGLFLLMVFGIVLSSFRRFRRPAQWAD